MLSHSYLLSEGLVTNGEESFKQVSVFPRPPAVDSTFTEVASTPKPTHCKFLIIADKVYYKMNLLFDRYKFNRHKTLMDCLL